MKFFFWSFSRQYKIFNNSLARDLSFFFLWLLRETIVNGAIRACVRACVYAGVRASYVDIAYTRPKAVLHVTKIVQVYCTSTSASLSDAHTRTRSFAPSCAREFTSCVLLARNRSILILVRFTADRRWCIVSYVSIGISSLPRAPISARPSFPSAPPFPPPSPPPRSLFLSFSFALSL